MAADAARKEAERLHQVNNIIYYWGNIMSSVLRNSVVVLAVLL